ncbi:hypothetical protein PG991_016032 [Apiospora marii]|uniref:F-box domain-containing protein n=1 Tax=Apiospora marii TaxID=335849 RepID=A0ABR1R0D1_9PEZI
MPKLAKLPTEVMNMILTALVDMNLKTLSVAPSVSVQFCDLIENLVFRTRTRHQQPTESGELELDPFLRIEFSSLVDALEPKYCPKRLYEMFQQLPWAQTEASRERYLRPGASWRRLCLTVGGPSIIRLEHVSLKGRLNGSTDVSHSAVDRLSPWLTMGCLYDALLLGDLGLGADREQRGLRLGQRVVDYHHPRQQAFRLFDGVASSSPRRPELVAVYGRDAASGQTAVLQVETVAVDCGGNYDSFVGFRDLWYPWPQPSSAR